MTATNPLPTPANPHAPASALPGTNGQAVLGSTEIMIAARSLTRLYGCVIGVNDITIDIPSGVRGLLGPNGAGKSTFLKLITGQIRPTEGAVRVLGEQPWNNPDLFRRIGFCPEADAFYRFMTGFEFVKTLAQIGGTDSATAAKQAVTALARTGCADFMHRKIATYSKGMRQRTKVAQAIVHDPQLVILDEPLNGTDPMGRRQLIDLVKELGREGKSVLMSSHVLHEVQQMTDEFTLIFNGRVLASGNVAEIRGLMLQHPHRITIRCSDARQLGWRLMRDLPITGLHVAANGSELVIHTHDPSAFYARVAEAVVESGVAIEDMRSQDDNLEAVFDYLVQRD